MMTISTLLERFVDRHCQADIRFGADTHRNWDGTIEQCVLIFHEQSVTLSRWFSDRYPFDFGRQLVEQVPEEKVRGSR